MAAAVAVVAVCAVAVVAAPVVAPVVGVATTAFATGMATTGIIAGEVAIGASIIAAVEEPLPYTEPFPTDKIQSFMDELKNKLGKFGIGECISAAQYLNKELQKRGEHGAVITLTWPYLVARAGAGKGGYVWSDIKQETIGWTGVHMGVEYNGIVYCNVHPSGLPQKEWINDFYGMGPKSIHITRF